MELNKREKSGIICIRADEKGREWMSNNKIDLADFNELLSLQTAPTVQADPAEPTPAPTSKELAQQKAIMKVYRKYQQRE